VERTDGLYDRDAEFYDVFYADVDDVDLYISLARRFGGPVLDAMCGTGRIAIPLAHAGFEVTGIDSHEGMLERARRKAAAEEPEVARRIVLKRADLRQLDLGRQFCLVVAAFASFNHFLEPADQDRAMAALKRHVADRGALVIATFNPLRQTYIDKLDKEVELPNGDLLIRYSTGIVDGDSGIIHMKYRWEVERKGGGSYREVETEFDLKLLRANQLKALMAGAGLQAVERYGGYRGEPLTPESDWIVLVATPRPVRTDLED